jgi:hypothetical protein
VELDNHSKVPALLWRTAIDEHRIAAAVLARVTYRLERDGLRVDDEQPWLVDTTEWEGPRGTMPPDDCFVRGGIDLLVLGSARAPGGRPRPLVEVRVALGRFVTGVDVYGERVWAAGLGREPTATAPVPFVERPLTLAHAYGGKGEWDGLEVPYVPNPDGKGYYREVKDAIHRPLPNLEDPRRPIRSWKDSPDPVGTGLCPRAFGPRIQRSVDVDARGRLTRIKPTFFNDAFPDFIAPRIEPGDRFSASGVHVAGPIEFTVPAPPLMARIAIGTTDVQRRLEVDQIALLPDEGRVFITYRYPFRYAVIRMQERACELHWAERAP